MGLAKSGLTLTLLHFRILLVDDIQAAFATYNFAVGGTLFERSTNFHSAIISCIGTKFVLWLNHTGTYRRVRGLLVRF